MNRKTYFYFIFLNVCAIWLGLSNAVKVFYDVVAVRDCDIPKEDYVSDPLPHSVEVVTVRKRHNLRVKIIVTAKTLPVLSTITGYDVKKKKMDYEVSNLTCTNPVVSVVWKKLHLKYDKRCCLLPGSNKAVNINMDEMFMKFKVGTYNYGDRLYEYDLKLSTKNGALLCISTRINVTILSPSSSSIS